MKKIKFLNKDKISQLPETSGVYAFKKGREFLYIGKAANIRERVKSHFQPIRPGSGQAAFRDSLFIHKVTQIGHIRTDSEIEALILETNLIKKYQPKYNVVWRDDKNYFFVGETKDYNPPTTSSRSLRERAPDFPRIFITHQPKPISKFKIPIANFVGPFVDGKALKQTLKILRKVFPYRSCKTLPNRPCLWYHLNRCPAPCLLKSKLIKEIPPDGAQPKTGRVEGGLSSLKLKKLFQGNAKNLIKILKEGKNPVLKELKKEMKKASKNQDFETAGKIRNQISALERVMEHAKIFEPEAEKLNWPATEKKLKEILQTKNKVSKIEAYDVSNIQGQTAAGSMVAFINGLPDKNFYRKFKIKITGKPNDVAMLRECLNRRFKHKEWPYPDLILIDGGRAQLNAAIKTLKSITYHLKPGVMALAKKRNELFIENQKNSILLENLPREIFNLILQLRDEAHRFARKYHLKLREVDFFQKP